MPTKTRKTEKRVKEIWKTHETHTLHENGLYRHYRINLPEAYSWVDIITWPGHLTITGDLSDTYTFRRENDMLKDFFDHANGIDYRYWAGKLTIPRPYESTQKWDYDVFAHHVQELFEDGEIDQEALEDSEFVTDKHETIRWYQEHDLELEGFLPGMTVRTDYIRACNLIALFVDEWRKTNAN